MSQWQNVIAAGILAVALLLSAWIVKPVDRYYLKFLGSNLVAVDRATGELYLKTTTRGPESWKRIGDAIP